MKNHKNLLQDERGFTLIEVISVLIILGILAATAVPKYIALEEDAKNRAIDAGIAELNGREKLMWARQLLSGLYKDDSGDADLFDKMVSTEEDGYNLGDAYLWSANDPPDETKPPPKIDGGNLKFLDMKIPVKLKRISSDRTGPAIWVRAVASP